MPKSRARSKFRLLIVFSLSGFCLVIFPGFCRLSNRSVGFHVRDTSHLALHVFGIIIYRFRLSVCIIIARVPLSVLVGIDEHSHVVGTRIEVEKVRNALLGNYFFHDGIRPIEQLNNNACILHACQCDKQCAVIVFRFYFKPFLYFIRNVAINIYKGGAIQF